MVSQESRMRTCTKTDIKKSALCDSFGVEEGGLRSAGTPRAIRWRHRVMNELWEIIPRGTIFRNPCLLHRKAPGLAPALINFLNRSSRVALLIAATLANSSPASWLRPIRLNARAVQ